MKACVCVEDRAIRGLYLFAAWLITSPALAQDLSLPPTFGSVNLEAGFLPDPFVKLLIAGGPVKTALAGVKAHIAEAPDFQLYYTAGIYPLTITVESAADTTLLVNLPDGTWIADDDGGGNLNPLLHFKNPQSGRYDVYVGTFGKANAKANLIITELNPHRGGVGLKMLTGLQPRLGLQQAKSGSAATDQVERSQTSAKRIRVLVANDTDAVNIGANIVIDNRRILKVLREAAPENSGLLVIDDVLTGDRVTRDNILSHYQKLETAPSDTLLFLYSGHGGVDRTSGHYLALTHGGALFRSELRREMQAKPHQLLVIITDSCGSFPEKAGIASGLARAPVLSSVNRQIIEHLLLRHRGLVDLNGAREGTFAYSMEGQGGFFTRAFADLLYEPTQNLDFNRDGFVDWPEFYAALKQRLHLLNHGQEPQPYSRIPDPPVGPPPPIRSFFPRFPPDPSNPNPPRGPIRGRL
jgi:hypothetical protein